MTTSRNYGQRIALAAALIAIGNITSRLIGVIREAVFAATFGRGSELAAFTAAATIPTLVYDLLVSGAMSAALVPVFSRVVGNPEVRDRLLSQVLSVLIVVVSGVVLPILWFAPQVVQLIAGGFDADLQALTVTMVRWMMVAVPCMVVAGVMTAMLQAKQQFVFPAFVTSVFNIGLIVGAVVLTRWFGPVSLAIGMLIGALAQIALQWYGLRQSVIQWRTDWRDPALLEMLRLYAPVALGMGFSALGTIIDRRYASDFGAAVLPTMRYATTLIQFPLGLVAAAVSTAILPSLSQLNDDANMSDFRRMVGQAVNVVIMLIIPASVVLWLVRIPLTSVVLERQAFVAEDTVAVARTLAWYIPGLPAAAVDQILLFACYARGRTLAPNLVQGGAIIAYVLAVTIGIPWLGQTAETLAWANSVQWIMHMVLMAIICHRMFDLRGLYIGQTVILGGMAAAVTWCVVAAMQAILPMQAWPSVVQLVLLAGGAGATFVVVGWQLRIQPMQDAYALVWTRIRDRVMRRISPRSS